MGLSEHCAYKQDGWDQNGLQGPRAPGFLGYPGVLQHQQDRSPSKTTRVSNKCNVSTPLRGQAEELRLQPDLPPRRAPVPARDWPRRWPVWQEREPLHQRPCLLPRLPGGTRRRHSVQRQDRCMTAHTTGSEPPHIWLPGRTTSWQPHGDMSPTSPVCSERPRGRMAGAGEAKPSQQRPTQDGAA